VTLLKQAQQLIIDTGNPTIWLQQAYKFHALDPKLKGVTEDMLSPAVGAGNPSGLPQAFARQLWLSA
jgi:hypothetical protein